MYCTNTMKITLKNNTVANKVLAILRNRLNAGLDIDTMYRRIPSQMMSKALTVVENTVVLPEEFGYCTAGDAADAHFELVQFLAMNVGNDSFIWEGWDNDDYTDGEFNARYENGLLNIKHICYPSGFGATAYCEECGEDVVSIVEYEEGKVYVCPECGEVVDLSEYLPITTEKTVQIF